MKIRMAASAACTFLAFSAAGIAIAQTAWPQLTQGDLEACRTVIAQVHRKEVAYQNTETTHYCTPGTDWYDAENCKNSQGWLAETKAQDDVAWYFKGNDHCEGSDYPCFGPGLFNDPRTGEEAVYWSGAFADMAAEGTIITGGMEFGDAARKSDNCLAGLWVKKAKAAGYKAQTSVAVQAAPKAAPTPAPVPTPTRITASDPVFQSNLKQFGADQLLGLTNELLETGDIDLAKLARNALLQRFPDSPLVPIVVQLMTSATRNGAPAATPAPAPVSSVPVATPATGQRVYLNDGPSLIAAFARIGVVLKAVPNTQEFQEGANLYSAYLSDCRNGQCHAVQLIAKYALNPVPSDASVQAWNLNKLYGRAYLSNDRATFDMTVLVPDAGIDIKSLEEAVALFKDATSAFYNSVKPQ